MYLVVVKQGQQLLHVDFTDDVEEYSATKMPELRKQYSAAMFTIHDMVTPLVQAIDIRLAQHGLTQAAQSDPFDEINKDYVQSFIPTGKAEEPSAEAAPKPTSRKRGSK